MSAEQAKSKHTIETVKADTGYLVKNADLVFQVALIYDYYKYGLLKEIWESAEKAMLEKMPLFKREELFYEKHMINPKEKQWYAFRYYSPAINIIERPQPKGH